MPAQMVHFEMEYLYENPSYYSIVLEESAADFSCYVKRR